MNNRRLLLNASAMLALSATGTMLRPGLAGQKGLMTLTGQPQVVAGLTPLDSP